MIVQKIDKNDANIQTLIKVAKNISDAGQKLIFKNDFIENYIKDVDYSYQEKHIPKNLIPNRCNFPGLLTIRAELAKNSKTKTKCVPCKRAVQEGYYFCKIPRHWQFALEYNLPFKQSGQITKKIQKTKIQSKKEEIPDVPDDVLVEFPRFQCIFESPIDGKGCKNNGIYPCFSCPDLKYCEIHSIVTDDFISNLVEKDCDEYIIHDFREIQKLDILLSNEKDQEKLETLVKKRLKLSNNNGFGINSKFLENINFKKQIPF